MKYRLRTHAHAGWMTTALCLAVVVVGVHVGCRPDYSGVFVSDEDFLASGRTLSFFTAIQVDPRSEDSAGPQFVVDADLNGDGLLDLVSAWNQSQPVQIHLQRRSDDGAISFETLTLAGNLPAVRVAGLAVADFDGDERSDIAVLIKNAPLVPTSCLGSQGAPEEEEGEGRADGAIVIYFGPTDATTTNQALAWEEVPVGASFLAGSGSGEGTPEVDGYTAMAVGDVDEDGRMDMVVAWNTDCGTNHVLVFTNQGSTDARDGTWIVEAISDPFSADTAIKDVALADIDGDDDLDIIATRPEGVSLNIHWLRNPTLDTPDDFHISDGTWQIGTVAQIATGADIIEVGDIDLDGIVDVVVRSTGGRLIQWLKGPAGATTAPLRQIPWQVFTLAEYTERTPEAIALGDLNFDGQLELIVAAEGGLAWFDSQGAETLFDQWTERLIVDDQYAGEGDVDPATTDPNVTPEEVGGTTFMNSLLVTDLDGDGANDLVVTLDRSGLSGISNDALVWFRNTRRPPR